MTIDKTNEKEVNDDKILTLYSKYSEEFINEYIVKNKYLTITDIINLTNNKTLNDLLNKINSEHNKAFLNRIKKVCIHINSDNSYRLRLFIKEKNAMLYIDFYIYENGILSVIDIGTLRNISIEDAIEEIIHGNNYFYVSIFE